MFEGDNIQAGQQDELEQIGLPTNPDVSIYDPSNHQTTSAQSKSDKKIPVINPIL